MMSIDIFPWNDNFNTGVSTIDEQHKKLVQLLNSLASHIAFQSDIPALNVIFDELIDYTVYHFQAEEVIWHQYFPEDPSEIKHKAVHNSFIETVLKLRADENAKPADSVIEEVLAFLTRWLASHILESDRHFALVVLAIQSGMTLESAKKQAIEQMGGSTRALIDIILSIYDSLSTNTLHLMREIAKHKRDEEFQHLLLETSPVAVHIAAVSDGSVLFANGRYAKLTGVAVDLAIGMDPKRYYANLQDYENIHEQLQQGMTVTDRLVELSTPGNKAVWVLATYLTIDYENQAAVLGWFYDVTGVRKTKAQLHLLAANVSDLIARHDLNGTYLFVTAACQSLTGYSEEELLGHSCYEFFHPDDVAVMQAAHAQILERAETSTVSYRLRRKNGSFVWVETTVRSTRDANNKAIDIIASTRDITERKQTEQQLRIAATAFESHEGMMVIDANHIILRVNKAFTDITGYSAEEVVGKHSRIRQSDRHNPDFYAAIWESINNTGVWEGELLRRRKNGKTYPEYLTVTAVKDTQDRVTHYVSTFSDMTLRQAAAEQIERLAFYDPLTNLPNRRLLQDRLKLALASSHRNGRYGALLFIDLDNFKTLNDTLGHDMGDLLLQQVAERLTACVREGDTVARLGGDEFVVMLEDLSKEGFEAARQAETLANKMLMLFNRPFQLVTREYLSTASIGATLFNGQQLSNDDLLKHADIAMYQAKTSGRNTLRFFDPQMQDIITARALLEDDLRTALANRQFQLYYQAQVDSSGRLLGAEALVRWIHPERGLVSPVKFIPLTEENGLIVAIGLWVLETACAQLKVWQQEPLTRDLVLSINVSAKQFFQVDFVQQVQAAIAYYAINPLLLKLEVTEGMLLENIEDTIITMHILRKIGVQFSLDDFGTGYSSLQYLKRLPLDQLKIDQSFVRDIAFDSDDQAIVRTIIAMAASLNLSVIAEGVETQEQRQLLLDNGCTNYQGYLFSVPVPIAQFENLLRQGVNHS